MRGRTLSALALSGLALAIGCTAASAHTGTYVFKETPVGAVPVPLTQDNGCGDDILVGVPAGMGAAQVCLDGSEQSVTVTITAVDGTHGEAIWSADTGSDASQPGGVICGTGTFAIPAGARDIAVNVGGDPTWCGAPPVPGVVRGWLSPAFSGPGSTVAITLS